MGDVMLWECYGGHVAVDHVCIVWPGARVPLRDVIRVTSSDSTITITVLVEKVSLIDLR